MEEIPEPRKRSYTIGSNPEARQLFNKLYKNVDEDTKKRNERIKKYGIIGRFINLLVPKNIS